MGADYNIRANMGQLKDVVFGWKFRHTGNTA